VRFSLLRGFIPVFHNNSHHLSRGQVDDLSEAFARMMHPQSLHRVPVQLGHSWQIASLRLRSSGLTFRRKATSLAAFDNETAVSFVIGIPATLTFILGSLGTVFPHCSFLKAYRWA